MVKDLMLDIANDIRSLSDFKRKTGELLGRLKKTGHPLVLTINGRAEVVVQDAEAYPVFRSWGAGKGLSPLDSVAAIARSPPHRRASEQWRRRVERRPHER